MRKNLALLLLASVLPWLAGCNWLGPLGAMMLPETRTKTVKAEYDGLSNSKVAVVIYADMDMLWRYQHLRYELGEAVNSQLRANVKGCQPLPAGKVIEYQDANLNWTGQTMPQIAQALGVEKVVYLSLGEFSTHEQGSMSLARGRISGLASVWLANPEGQNGGCVWENDNISVLLPEDQPLGLSTGNDEALRLETEKAFARKLVQFFHDHEVEKDPS